MLHFDSATTVQNGAVKHDTVNIAESDTGENGMPFPKQFPDTEPPFAKSCMDNMSTDTVAYDTLNFVIDNNFSLDSSILNSANLNISDRDFEIGNYNIYSFCELRPADHFQGG
ncbi:hypothetical protein CYMTET_24556 [Cymbomonas tetramitiformis]|uniref:Uncharacterized protein n=1 Tax=Cymbomonas tetramitiformis TaxID=36881 RepID=A0AAE0KZT3_9CHLO|nr:hypothetical protein CYMTET_24556 [Cymbomonas tetramitiformis]